MRMDRIVNRWNLKSRAKAGRYLLNWHARLVQGAINLVRSGYEQGMADCKNVAPPPPTETQHSDAAHDVVDRPSSGGSTIIADKDSHL
jgi:hypothetical protein